MLAQTGSSCNLPMYLIPHMALLEQGVWGGSLPITVLPAMQHKAPVLGQRLKVKQDTVGQRGTDCERQAPRRLGLAYVTLTTNTRQWPFPATLLSYSPCKSMPGTTHVPTMSLSSLKWQMSLPASPSLPVIQPATQSGSSWGIPQGRMPRPQKGAWQAAHIFSSPTYILRQWVGIDLDI